MNVVAESEELHARVRAFAAAGTAAAFAPLALDIARFQARHSPGFARLVERRGASLASVEEIPPVPVEAFRLARVAVHPAELDAARFETSGTTSAARGVHAMRTTSTYRQLSLQFGRAALLGAEPRALVVALAPVPALPCSSSLGFMMLAMMEEFDGRPLGTEDSGRFQARTPGRWLLAEQGVDVRGLEAAASRAGARGEPLLVLATSFALVSLLDALAGRHIAAPPRSVIMQTGGFKGRSREVDAQVLRRETAQAFGVAETQVIGEYGMTELTSQLYDHGDDYVAPPWLQVQAVDPVSLRAVPDGEPGLARFVDLGNVDSALAVVTQDVIRSEQGRVRLCGRAPLAEARGCSLAIEELLYGVTRP